MATVPNQEFPEKTEAEELADINTVLDRDDEKLRERLEYELARLRGIGVVNEDGELVDPQLPPDMVEGSGCDLG